MKKLRYFPIFFFACLAVATFLIQSSAFGFTFCSNAKSIKLVDQRELVAKNNTEDLQSTLLFKF